MKVIQILHHSQAEYASEIRFWKEDWHAKVAKQILKRTDRYEIECWRPERRAKRVITGEEDGIVYKIFPSLYLKFGREYSIPLLRELGKESKKEDILIHLQGIHNHLAYLIAYLLRDLPIVGSQLGSAPYTYHYLNPRKMYHKLYFFPLCMLEPHILRGMDRIFAATKDEYNVLSKFHSGVELFHSIGVDFEKFKPLKKQEVRKMLNLPSDKKIMLHVGRFTPSKGIDIILDTYKKLKDKYDVKLLLIGGQKTDSLYEKAVKEGAIVIERIPHEELIPYYNAADVYLLPSFNKNLMAFGGIGVATTESLACGTPVVSTSMRHFMGEEAELEGIGKIPKTPEDIAKCVSEIFNDPNSYSNCREIARKYYDWGIILKYLINIYDKLFEKYSSSP